MSPLRYFLSVWSTTCGMGLFLTSSAPQFRPLHEHSKHMLPAAGDRLDGCLETKLFFTTRQSDVLGRQDKTRQDKTRRDETRQDETRRDKTRQDETRRDKTRQDETRRDETRRDETRQDETGRDRTRQDKTGQDRTRQDKTRRKSDLVHCSGCLKQGRG
jgi:hypothetical protein